MVKRYPFWIPFIDKWYPLFTDNLQHIFGPSRVVPYKGYIGMCHSKGYVFLAVLV